MTTSYRDAAVALWGEAGAYAHDCYARWLPLFPALPPELPIVIGITAYGKCIGSTLTSWEHGPRITLFSSIFGRGRRWVDDTMVHEMLHAELALQGQDTSHDSEAWYAAVRRLSPAVLGHELDAQRGKDRKSVRVPNPNYGREGEPRTLVRKVRADDAVPHSHVASWPVRPATYQWGERIRCPTY